MVFSYNSHAHPDRFRKTQQCLKHLGSTILTGGCVGILPGLLYMVLAAFMMNIKLGMIIVYALIFSMLYSLCFLPALLHTAGPQNNLGAVIFCKNEYTSIREYEL